MAAAEVVLRLKGPVTLGGVQVRLKTVQGESVAKDRKMTKRAYVADTRVHDLYQRLSGLQVLGLDDIVILHRYIAVGLLYESTSSLLGNGFVGVKGHLAEIIGRSCWCLAGVRMTCYD